MFDVYCSYSQTAAYCFIRGKCYLFRLPFYMHLMRGGAVNVGHTLFLEKNKQMARMMAVSSFADERLGSLVMRSAYQDTCQVYVFCVFFFFCVLFFFSQRLLYYTVVKHQFSYVFNSYFDMK